MGRRAAIRWSAGQDACLAWLHAAEQAWALAFQPLALAQALP